MASGFGAGFGGFAGGLSQGLLQGEQLNQRRKGLELDAQQLREQSRHNIISENLTQQNVGINEQYAKMAEALSKTMNAREFTKTMGGGVNTENYIKTTLAPYGLMSGDDIAVGQLFNSKEGHQIIQENMGGLLNARRQDNAELIAHYQSQLIQAAKKKKIDISNSNAVYGDPELQQYQDKINEAKNMDSLLGSKIQEWNMMQQKKKTPTPTNDQRNLMQINNERTAQGLNPLTLEEYLTQKRKAKGGSLIDSLMGNEQSDNKLPPLVIH